MKPPIWANQATPPPVCGIPRVTMPLTNWIRIQYPRRTSAGMRTTPIKNPHAVLYVVAEDPEIHHIAGQVQQPAVDEHGREYGEVERLNARRRRQVHAVGEFVGDHAILQVEAHRPSRSKGQLIQEHQDVEGNDCPGDVWCGPAAIDVPQRYHLALYP